MTIKSIELSDIVYNKLKALKNAEESWDDFLLRIAIMNKVRHPTDKEWSNAYNKAFNKNSETFEKLAN